MTRVTWVCLSLGIGLSLGCGGSSSRGASASTVAASTSSASGSTTSGNAAAPASATPTPAPTPIAQRVRDASFVPSAPPGREWYFERDDPGTAENEAAREIARAVAAGGNGLDEGFVYEHLTQGGGPAIFVSGNNHERDDPPTRTSGWLVAYASQLYELGYVALQVDYANWAAGGAVSGPLGGAVDLATYNSSHVEGVLRTEALLSKAIAAGSRDVRLIGHSKGGDVVQEVAHLRRGEPRLSGAFAFGIPLWCPALPGAQGATRRGGMWRLGALGARDYRGKLVVFVRQSDRSSHGEFFPPNTFPGPGHDYANVLADPGFRALLERALTEPVGWSDRSLGQQYDW